ncbi:MAG: hypothetical protein ABI446_05255 [Gemmatimonadaceae bacterium]
MSDGSSSPNKPAFMKVDGLEVRYATSAKVGAPTVVMIGPWPESIHAYLPMWDALATDFSLIAFDLPGYGGSEGRTDLMSPHSMGGFVIELADAISVDRFHGIGPDIGVRRCSLPRRCILRA